MREEVWIIGEIFFYWIYERAFEDVWIPGGGGQTPIHPASAPGFIGAFPVHFKSE